MVNTINEITISNIKSNSDTQGIAGIAVDIMEKANKILPQYS